ncbi:BA75_01395T0 [Komagataella pastoris]|uniref:PAN2-PAN3 deadenylation complex catalytic subunit PAN2 n=1 Tax=Komagataella pastoris TaxID=4922 RepID=A0A1B2J5P7_PICPA|nr:BA75_01395T0 [Komagataella pastoris]
MEGWNEINRVPCMRPSFRVSDPSRQSIPSALLFDDSHDLTWIGSEDGFVKSLADQMLTPYTSFRCHSSKVLQLLNNKRGILSLSENSIKLTSRTGLCRMNLHDISVNHSRSMAYTSNTENEILLGGFQGKLVKLNLMRGEVSDTVPYDAPVYTMSANLSQICLGRVDGTVDVLDPRSNDIVASFSGHMRTLSSMDCRGNTLITTGYSVRNGTFYADPLANLYDLRTKSLMPPVTFPAGASFVKLHPKLPNVAILASSAGLIHFVNLYSPMNVSLYQADVGSYMNNFEISPSGDFMGFTDSFQNVHLWSNAPDLSSAHIPNLASSLEQATMVPPPTNSDIIPADSDSTVPLSSIGMPYYDQPLLSNWPFDMKFSLGHVPKKINPELINSSKSVVENYNAHAFGQNNLPSGMGVNMNIPGVFKTDTDTRIAVYSREKYGPRNVAQPYYRLHDRSNQKNKFVPKFISERLDADEKGSSMTETTNSDFKDTLYEQLFDCKPHSSQEVPYCFTKLDIHYSKFGVHDFDFEFFNKTNLSGLESHVQSAYCNSLLQLYRFAPLMFNYAVGSLAEESVDNNSLLTELGFLFDMMVKASGQHIAPSNFQKMLSKIPEASRILDIYNNGYNRDEHSQRVLIHSFNNFLLERISLDEMNQAKSNAPHIFNTIMGIPVECEFIGVGCGLRKIGNTTLYSLDVRHPKTNNVVLNKKLNHSIIPYIELALSRNLSVNMACDNCSETHAFDTLYTVKDLPPILSLNLELTNQELSELKASKSNWLASEFYASMNKGRICLKSITTGFRHLKYELLGYVAQVTDKEGNSNLVTFVKVGKDEWFLFNDFLVMPISEHEVLNLNYWWKKPVIVIYKNSESTNMFDYEGWRQNLNQDILYRDHFSRGTREGKIIEYELLTKEEAPQPGTLVAIDAEFVVIEPELVEFNSDGTKKVIRPLKNSLARVSVLRGDTGPKEGIPFIDDYVIIEEPINDYLTSWSGIEPDDLNLEKSKRSLTTLQAVYRKLWLLLNLGCIFVGHGLINDFRTINLSVPKQQVRDTAELYFLKMEKRKLSLKFLTYAVLRREVQKGNHDSIEDAKAALMLYRKYIQLNNTGELQHTLEEVYMEGQMLSFRVPT